MASNYFLHSPILLLIFQTSTLNTSGQGTGVGHETQDDYEVAVAGSSRLLQA